MNIESKLKEPESQSEADLSPYMTRSQRGSETGHPRVQIWIDIIL